MGLFSKDTGEKDYQKAMAAEVLQIMRRIGQ
jgi:hypothetical protein